MLYVKEVAEVLPDGSIVKHIDIEREDKVNEDSKIRVVLEDTITGEHPEFICDTFADVVTELNKVMPYGYADRVGEKIADWNELIAVDDLSLRFLDFVEEVREEVTEDHYRYTGTCDVEPIDAYNSLFLCSIEEENLDCLCTLLQIVSYVANSTKGDTAVFYGCKWFTDDEADKMTEEEYDDYNPVRKYTVVFSDVQSAMRLIAKYRIAGNNPLQRVFGEYDSSVFG